MKWFFNKLPKNEDFDPVEEGYKGINEPSNVKIFIMKILVATLVVIVVGFIIKLIIGVNYKFAIWDNYMWFVILIVIIPIHELLHVILLPERITSTNIYFGYYRGSFYVDYANDIKKNRYLLVGLFPLLLLTLFPIICISIFKSNIEILSKIALINGMLSCGDIISFFVILRQIPKGAYVRNKGDVTYWKC
ncbi:metalloprotease family protein [Acetobacterium tundrae]|uniref:metalloprotease family protein n=1 Tax=Acetobacterium tundrae TaxID=132932 RepID=UPI00164B9B1E|nr:metalloprotease family protein [Acetobacterium tundrae]